MEKLKSTFAGDQQPPAYGDGASQAFRTTFASLSMHSGDMLRLLGFPSDVTDTVRLAIQSGWPGGIQREREYYGSYEFKLHGYPWRGQGSNAVHSRRLVSRVLKALAEAGWVLNLTTDASKNLSDLDTLLFRHQSPPPAPCEWMCISFSNADQIRFIDAPDAGSQEDVVSAFINVLKGAVQRHEPHRVEGCYEIKLKGYPWTASGGESMLARALLLQLLTTLEEYGWTVYASVDQKERDSSNSGHGETETWHCFRTIGWAPGLPVYHN